MEYTFEEIKEAYLKLRTYIYYDSSNLFMRVSLAEFETDEYEPQEFFDRFFINNKYVSDHKIEAPDNLDSIDKKLFILTYALNNYHEKPEYINYHLSKIEGRCLPKKIENENADFDSTIISNKRTADSYDISRISIFIEASIELHIISVLWIMKKGFELDRGLYSNCFGNRLILNKNKDAVVQGSSLFKPYPRQYQKWRDSAIEAARSCLSKNDNVHILNLDIKDFFYSVRIPIEEIGAQFSFPSSTENLYVVFAKIHEFFTKLLVDKYKYPYNIKSEVLDKNGEISKVVLPIGLLSSFILANYHLSPFDEKICSQIRPKYYGRYVDDLLIVLSSPDITLPSNLKPSSFNIEDYKKWLSTSKYLQDEKLPIELKNLTSLEKFVLNIFSPIINLISTPKIFVNYTNSHKHLLKIQGYERLYCQSDKSTLYYFDKDETTLVIDKLKKDLEEKSSEFRNYEDAEGADDFEKSAYHLLYDGSEGKVRTLKDYREDRFGLSVYLSKRIFNALRSNNHISKDEASKIVNFFKGTNVLSLYPLWERVFTFLLVNGHALSFVEFYLNCANAIDKMKLKNYPITLEQSLATDTSRYLEYAHELSLSLHPSFISNLKIAKKTYEYSFNNLKNAKNFFQLHYSPTDENSYFINRFRESNLVRHHYTAQTLISYTNDDTSIKNIKNLTEVKLDFEKYNIASKLILNSPRLLKFWECCLSSFYEKLSSIQPIHDDTFLFDFNTTDENKKHHLNKSFELFKSANSKHSNSYSDIDSNDIFLLLPNKDKTDYSLNEIVVNNKTRNLTPRIAVVNTKILDKNIESAVQSKPNLEKDRFDNLYKIFKQAKSEKADILLFPECFVPAEYLDRIVWYSAKEQKMIVTGLEHISINGYSFNFIVTILPFELNGIKDAVVTFRLKNHYSYGEAELIQTNHLKVPRLKTKTYDLFNWRGIYFSSYYCFELADVRDRSLFKSKIDLMIASEYNRDTNYFSNIVESIARDLHVYVAQVNTSHYGDTRITQPADTVRKDILKLKGGLNDTLLIGVIDIEGLRSFQKNLFLTTKNHDIFKPLPPDFDVENVYIREKNHQFFK